MPLVISICTLQKAWTACPKCQPWCTRGSCVVLRHSQPNIYTMTPYERFLSRTHLQGGWVTSLLSGCHLTCNVALQRHKGSAGGYVVRGEGGEGFSEPCHEFISLNGKTAEFWTLEWPNEEWDIKWWRDCWISKWGSVRDMRRQCTGNPKMGQSSQPNLGRILPDVGII